MTTLAEYQEKAAATAQAEAYDHNYLVPMIVGEVGELFGQKAKAVWHGWDADALQTELIAEYGDVCWGTAILLQMHGIHTLDETAQQSVAHKWLHKVDPWHSLLHRAEALHLFHSEDQEHHLLDGAQKLWALLELRCEEITGAPFQDALDYNIAKLASRAARNKLRGNGDHR